MSDWGTPLWGEVTPDDPAPSGGSSGSGSGAGGGSTPPNIISFTPSTTTSTPGASVTIDVAVQGATTGVTVSPDVGPVSANGTITVHPTTTTTYTLTASNDGGSSQISITITIVGAVGENIRFHQVRRNDRFGAGTQFAMADGTGRVGDIAGYLDDGTLTRVAASSLAGGGTGSGSALFVYGQVPRGTVDGVNRFFRLDYVPASPFMWLVVNGIEQKPPVDGTAPNPNPDYTVSGANITYAGPPLASDWHYCKYYKDTIAPPIATRVSASAYLTSAHYPDPNSDQWGAGYGFNDVVSLFSPPSWHEEHGTWDKRTDIHILSNTELASMDAGTLYLLMEQFHLGNFGGLAPPPWDDEFWIYDAYIQFTMSDGTTQTWRPTEFEIAGPVSNAAFAIDGDDRTYAVILATSYAAGGYDGSALALKTWVRTA